MVNIPIKMTIDYHHQQGVFGFPLLSSSGSPELCSPNGDGAGGKNREGKLHQLLRLRKAEKKPTTFLEGDIHFSIKDTYAYVLYIYIHIIHMYLVIYNIIFIYY